MPEGSARQRNIVGDPRIHRLPGFHHLRIVEIVPKLQIVSNVVLNRLESLGAVIDHLARHIAERRQNFIHVEVSFINPARESHSLFVGKIQRSRQEGQIAQAVIGAQCRVHPLPGNYVVIAVQQAFAAMQRNGAKG